MNVAICVEARGPTHVGSLCLCLFLADTVEKVFWGWRTKFSRAADAFRAQRCEGPLRFSEKRPRTFVLALCTSQRRTCPKINFCEIFGVFRFSTFSTVSVKLGPPAMSDRRPFIPQQPACGDRNDMSVLCRFCCRSRVQGIGSFGLLLGATA